MGKEHDAAQTTTAYGELPEFPGNDFLAHHATTWLENATAKLAVTRMRLNNAYVVLESNTGCRWALPSSFSTGFEAPER